MNKFILKIRMISVIFIGLLLSVTTTFAQDPGTIEMADTMRSNGKIYVVITVLSVLFCGLFIYLIRLDSRISRMEKERKQGN